MSGRTDWRSTIASTFRRRGAGGILQALDHIVDHVVVGGGIAT